VLKPRYGFYITEKFPKVPDEENEKEWSVKIPDGAVVVYNMDEFLNTPDDKLLKYCEELIEYWNLSWSPKELLDLVCFSCITEKLPKDRELAKEKLKRLPGIEIVEDEENNA